MVFHEGSLAEGLYATHLQEESAMNAATLETLADSAMDLGNPLSTFSVRRWVLKLPAEVAV